MGAELNFYEVRVDQKRATSTWQRDLSGLPVQAPRLVEGALVVASRDPQTGVVTVLAVDPASKEERWKTELGKLPLALRTVPSAPTDLLVIQGGETFTLEAASQDQDKIQERPIVAPAPGAPKRETRLRMLRGWTDGVVEWAGVGHAQMVYHPVDGPPQEITLASPAAARPVAMGQGLLVPGADGLLYWIDPRTGTELAEPFVGPYANGQPVPLGAAEALEDETAVVIAGERLLKIRLVPKPFPHFEEIGRAELPGRTIAHLEKAGGTLFAQANQAVLALDPETLATRKELDIGAPVKRSPVPVDDAVLLLTEANELACVEMKGAESAVRWRTKLETTPIDEPVLEGTDAFWLPFADGQLRLQKLSDGSVEHEIDVGRAIVDGPWTVGERLVVLAPDGSVTSIARETAP